MEINRDLYLNRLIVRKNNNFIKVITGIRRSGKSYLLNNIFYNYLLKEVDSPKNIIRFAFDSAEDLIKIGEDPLLINSNKEEKKADPKKFLNWLMPQINDDKKYYLLLDEVQKLDAFEACLNGFLRRQNIDIYVTGSNSKFLSKDVITEFAGRGDEVHIYPLSFSEYYNFKKGDKAEAFDSYSVYGGLPAVALMATDEQKVAYLTSQMQNLYLRDIINRYNVRDSDAMSEIMDVLASGIGALTNPRKIANTMNSIYKKNTSDNAISKYINYMEEAFIISKVKRFDIKGRKYIGTPYKVYFEDIGLRNARLSFRQIEPTHIMENIIYNELKYRGFQVDVGVVESRKKDALGHEVRIQNEIDFIASNGSKKYYIQSAYAILNVEKYEQERSSFKKITDAFKKIIILERSMKPRYDDNGYLTMGVKEFLLDQDSLNI